MSERSIDVRPLRILFAGGGTGGHLFPAIAIAESVRLLEPTAEIEFVGTRDKIEARVVPRHGFRLRTIWISGFHRGLKLRNLLFPLKVLVAMVQAKSILKEFNPDVVVGTGGYVAGPVLRSAVHRNIRTVIQEQNSYPGVTTRLLAKQVNEVHITFEQSRKYLSGVKAIFLSGNPTREALENVDRREALSYFGFDESSAAATVLVLGGSLGAHSINEAVKHSLKGLRDLGVYLIWQTGPADEAEGKHAAESLLGKRAWVSAFVDKMEFAYAASDLVVSRAGATTLAELTRLGKPAILVPYPHAAANHQYENAKALSEHGAARIISDEDVRQKLVGEIQFVLDDARLTEMSSRSRRLGKPDAARSIAARVIALAQRARNMERGDSAK